LVRRGSTNTISHRKHTVYDNAKSGGPKGVPNYKLERPART